MIPKAGFANRLPGSHCFAIRANACVGKSFNALEQSPPSLHFLVASMTDFSLEIQIDTAGLQTIANAGMSVAILVPQAQAAYQIVALQTSASSTIHIDWSDANSIYVSVYDLQAYAIPMISTSQAALPGQVFTYDGAAISQTGSTSLPGTLQLTNSSGGTVTSGLSQVFTVNGQAQPEAITTASSILNNGLGSFQFSNQILLTLLGGAQTGMAVPSQVIPGIQSKQKRKRSVPQISVQPPLILDFTSSNATQTVHFNDLNNQFINGALP